VTKPLSAPEQRDEQLPPADSSASTGMCTKQRILNTVAIGSLVLSLVLGIVVDGATLWGLLPIGIYGALAIFGMDVMVATVVSVASAMLILLPAPTGAADILGESIGDQVTMIGLIIMLGAGLAEVMRVTGVAGQIVRSVMRVAGDKSQLAFILGTMVSCLILVAALGTLAGALAVAAPLLLPMAAKKGFTRSATASMIFIGGCAGLAIAPFAGSNVAIMSAAEVGYLQYLLVGGGPLAILSLVMGLVVVPWMQRRTCHGDDFYNEHDLGLDEEDAPHQRRATAVFMVGLLTSIVYAAVTSAGITFPLLALPVIAILTGLAGGLTAEETGKAIYRGAGALIHIFLLFWLLAVMFVTIDLIDPFSIVVASYGDSFQNLGPFPFAIAIALFGWVGVPGAAAAEVVLLNQIFGDMAATIGVSVSSWVIVLLWASKADTYGPFPNANMMGAMGLSRSFSLKNMLITGWALLIPASVMYTIIMFIETR